MPEGVIMACPRFPVPEAVVNFPEMKYTTEKVSGLSNAVLLKLTFKIEMKDN